MSLHGQPRFLTRAHATSIIAALHNVGFSVKSVDEYGSSAVPMLDIKMTAGMSDEENDLRDITITLRYKGKKDA